MDFTNIEFRFSSFFPQDLEQEKGRSSILALTANLGKICRDFYMWRKDSIQPCSVISLLSKRQNKIKTNKKGGGKKSQHRYPSRVVWKRPWEDHFPLWGLLLVAFICSWAVSLPASPILSFPVTVMRQRQKLTCCPSPCHTSQSSTDLRHNLYEMEEKHCACDSVPDFAFGLLVVWELLECSHGQFLWFRLLSCFLCRVFWESAYFADSFFFFNLNFLFFYLLFILPTRGIPSFILLFLILFFSMIAAALHSLKLAWFFSAI